MSRHLDSTRDRPQLLRADGGFGSARRLCVSIGLCAVALAVRSHAEEPSAAPPPVLIEPVVVTATRMPQPQAEVPAAISVVQQPDSQDGRQTVGVDEVLNRVPGVFVQNSGNFAQDERIQIRGFGTRAAFGTREIRVLVDGLPETLPDGQTELDAVDLGAMQRIEVLRGPAAALYGNASGGVIQLFTEDGPQQPYAEARLTGGSFGLQKYQVKGGATVGRASFFTQASFFDLDGFRHHSSTRSTVVTSKLRYQLDENTDATLLLNGVDSPVADDAGGLTRAEADRDRRLAAPLNVRLDAGEAVQQGRIGTVVEHRREALDLSGYAYVLYRDFDNGLPVLPANGEGIVSFTRVSPGGGVKAAMDFPLWLFPHHLLVGGDAQHQDDDRRRFANNNGERGELRVQQRERVTGLGVYMRDAIDITDNFEVNGGARYDNVGYQLDVGTPAPSSASHTLDAWSPAAGARYTPLRNLSLFFNYGTAFQVPTTTELGNPVGAGFKTDLGPQHAESYEAGVRGDWNERVQAEVVGFWIDLTDEIVHFQAPSGKDDYRNAGSSRRYGVEVDWQASLFPGLRWTSAFTWIEAHYRNYQAPAGDFSDNAEPGIPDWHIYQELRYDHRSGAFAAAELVAVDDLFVDDGNTARSPGYEVVNLRAGIQRTFGRWTISPFVGLSNVGDVGYDGTVRLNAANGRFYEPAPGINAYGGFALRAQL